MQQGQKIRMTAQRRVILDELRKVKTHPTAGELCQMVRNRLPRISLGTVYRNLEILSRQGIIRKLDVGGTEMRFDGTTDNHYHTRCLGCGKVDDVELDLISGLEDQAARASGYEIYSHHLEFVGLCPRCREKRAAN